MYYGRYYSDRSGELISAGKFFGGTLGIYDWRDGEFHYDPRYEKMYLEGEYDEISDEEFERFKAKMDTRSKKEARCLQMTNKKSNIKNESGYYGRFTRDGEIVMAGKFIGGALSLYGPDGKFHYDQRYDKLYYEGEFDEISDEEFEEFKAEMDARGAK